MKVKTAFSQKENVIELVEDLHSQIGDFDARFIQVYASPKYNVVELNEYLYQIFGEVPMIGCTTAGELVTGKMLDQSVVLMAMSSEIVSDVKIEILENIDKSDIGVEKAFRSFSRHYGAGMMNLDTTKYVGLLLIDGLCKKEEEINERIGDLTNISFIGGSAGDDMAFKQTFVFANGKVYGNAAILALMKSNVPFEIVKTQSFETTGKGLVVTKSDEKNRTVLEFNGKPAVSEYAKMVGTTPKYAQNYFSKNPVGIVFQNDVYVRSPQHIENGRMVFYCSMKEGMELELLESKNIVDYTKNDLETAMSKQKETAAIINFNCILRTIELKEKKQTDAYGALFNSVPTVGFSTYGESYIGHINQTSTILVFS